VVVRLPRAGRSSGETSLDEGDVTLTKAFLSEAAAQEEAERLNDLNQDQWVYSVNVVRLVEEP